MLKRRIGLILVGLIEATAAALMLVAGSAAAAAEDIVIAVSGPMTGQYATLGEQMPRGAALAVEDINAAGGVLGQPLRLIAADDACDPRQAVSAANDVVRRGAILVVGHFCSSASIAASQVYTEEGILQISPASTSPKLTDEAQGRNVFRVCGRDDQQGGVAARYIAEHHRDGRIAILHDRSTYGKGLADTARAALNAAGITETLYEAYTTNESDFSALVTRIKQEAIDVVYLGGYHTEAGLILRQLRDQGSQAQFIAGDALVTDQFWSITGSAGEGALMTFGPEPRNRPEAAGVVQRFRARGQEPESYTLYAYAAVQVFAQAAAAAGSVELDRLADTMRSMTFDTVIGPIAFDEKGDVRQPTYVFYRWHDGVYREIE